MPADDTETLPAEIELALAHTPPHYRDAFWAVFDLDQRLARIVANATEPMLAQMRISWWREVLSKPSTQRPKGDAVLDAIGQCWKGHESALVELVDGWENLLEEPPLLLAAAEKFSAGRAAPFRSLAQRSERGSSPNGVNLAAQIWAIADAASKVSSGTERTMLVELGRRKAVQLGRLPREFRGLAVLAALSSRSLTKGGRPLMEGRSASLTAFRAALLGR